MSVVIEPGRVGPKTAANSRVAVCASQHAIVTETMVDVLRDGGNAVDAAIAGCLVQATVQQDMTNHTGTVSFLFFEAATGQTHYLNSSGTVAPDIPPLRRVPPGHGLYSAEGTSGPFAVIPGFMPGIKAMYERFGTQSWSRLCEPAVEWAERGHVVTSFEHLVQAQTVEFFLYTESGREHFTPDGHLPQVGDRWAQPLLARTLRRLADEGPDYFIAGEWAERFVGRANELGWKIRLDHMTGVPPRWDHGRRFEHRGFEVVQPSPPERQAVYCSIVLGILRELDVASLGHWSESAEALYYLAHALRRAALETGFVQDPTIFGDASAILMSPDYHRLLADVLRSSRPNIDLTRHVEIVAPANALVAAGGSASKQPAGSCELSIVDRDGNWVQMMNTLQGGGIPGEVIDGVPMIGSHAESRLDADLAGWFSGGGRFRSVMGSTIVLRDGQPVYSLGSPGNVHCTMPQVLSNLLDYGLDPTTAEDRPRILPLTDGYRVGVESRIPSLVVDGLARLGVQVDPLPRYDYHMGSFQMSWVDPDGTLHATAGPRREGTAAGL